MRKSYIRDGMIAYGALEKMRAHDETQATREIFEENKKYLGYGLLLKRYVGFLITGGFDLGVGALLPFVAKNDAERIQVLNSIGPTWEGNQVWLITAIGALFATKS